MNPRSSRHRFESLFDFPSNPQDLLSLTRRAVSRVSESIHPFPVSIERVEIGFELKADLPGVRKEAVDISISESVLTIQVSKDLTESTAHEFIFNERPLSGVEMSRRFYLREGLDHENLHASLKDGVLTLTIRKKVRPEAKKVDIVDEPIQATESEPNTQTVEVE